MLFLVFILLAVWLGAVILRSAIGTTIGGLAFAALLVAALGWPVLVIAIPAAAWQLRTARPA